MTYQEHRKKNLRAVCGKCYSKMYMNTRGEWICPNNPLITEDRKKPREPEMKWRIK